MLNLLVSPIVLEKAILEWVERCALVVEENPHAQARKESREWDREPHDGSTRRGAVTSTRFEYKPSAGKVPIATW